MSLQSNITSLATRIATECKSLRTLINGNAADLTALTTTSKTSLVSAINELQTAIASATGINDAATSTGSTWSSTKIVEELGDLKNEILGGAGAAFDTLQELATLISENDGDITGILTALNNRVRFDAAQTLTAPQKTQALANIGAAADTHTHSAATTSASGFMSAADKTKLDGVAASANNYVHPTTDGDRHVPATAAGDVNEFLKSNSVAGGAPAWAVITKTDVGLANVDNTSDASKPVSTAQATAIGLKLDATHAGTGGTAHSTVIAGGAAGFMTGADKTKLDAIAAGAEVNQNAFATIAVSGQTSVSADAKQDTLTLVNGTGVAITTDAATDTVTIGTTAATTGAAGHMSAADKTKLDGVATGATANSADATLLARANHTGTQSADTVIDGTTNKAFTATERTKLAGIEAAADVTDAVNVGTSIDGAAAKVTPVDADTMPLIDSAATNTLKKVTWANIKATLKTYFDTLYSLAGHVHSAATTAVAGFMSAADKTKLDGVATNANNYVHPTGDGSSHVPATGTTNSGKALVAGATANSAAWTQLTSANVGLGNVDNTSDANKPVSSAQLTALNLKANSADVGDTAANFVTTFNAGLV
jgi:hypothetical protein